jgi:hypothetical protein
MIITFNFDLNVSIQIGDLVYTSLTNNNQSGVNQPNSTSMDTKPFPIGVVTNVNFNTNTITLNTSSYPPVTLTSSHYLFFAKNTVVNTSGIIGYFAKVEYRNYSTREAEIFATAVDYVESSK